MANNLMVFGITTSRRDDQIVEEIMDALDEYLEDEWDMVAWRRRSSTKFLVRATVQARGLILDGLLKARISPTPDLLEEMTTSKVSWLVPKQVKVGTPGEMAERMVTKWMDSMWSMTPPEPDEPGGPNENKRVEPDAKPKSRPQSKKAETPAPIVDSAIAPVPDQNVGRSQAEMDVLAAFGLTGDEVGEDGEPINLFVMKS